MNIATLTLCHPCVFTLDVVIMGVGLHQGQALSCELYRAGGGEPGEVEVCSGDERKESQ